MGKVKQMLDDVLHAVQASLDTGIELDEATRTVGVRFDLAPERVKELWEEWSPIWF